MVTIIAIIQKMNGQTNCPYNCKVAKVAKFMLAFQKNI